MMPLMVSTRSEKLRSWLPILGPVLMVLAVLAVLGTLWGGLQGRQPPLKLGGRMIYRVEESMQKHKTSYIATVTLVERPDGSIELKVADPHGDRLFPVRPDLQPISAYDVLDVPISTGETVPVDSFWLTDDQAEQARRSSPRIQPWNEWNVRALPSSVAGNRLYELDSGVLVGFETKRGHLTIKGRLMAIR